MQNPDDRPHLLDGLFGVVLEPGDRTSASRFLDTRRDRQILVQPGEGVLKDQFFMLLEPSIVQEITRSVDDAES